MTAAFVSASALTYIQTWVIAGAAQQAVRDLRKDLFVHLQALSLRFFDQRSQGELMSRVTNDIENVSNVLNESVTQLIASVLSMVGIAVVMIWINPGLAAVTLVVVPFMTLGVTRFISKRTRVGFREQQAHLGELNGLVEETVTGQRVVKAYAREQTVIAEFDRANRGPSQGRDPGPDLWRLHGTGDEHGQQYQPGDRGRRGQPHGFARSGHSRHHRHLHQLFAPVRPPPGTDRQSLQYHPVGHRRGRACLPDHR